MEEFDAIVVGAGPGCAWVRGKKRDKTHNGEWGGVIYTARQSMVAPCWDYLRSFYLNSMF